MATTVSVLNELIETSKDGEQGFRKAADDAHDSELKSLLATCSTECATAARELQDCVSRIGGSPEMHGSMGGALHRGWIDLKSSLSKRTDQAVLEECERGEDVAKKHYRQALDADLPVDVRALVERQYQGVVRNHDRIRALRDMQRAQ